MATVGGNLFTPPPGGDVAVALLALDASVVLAGPSGERVLPLADFYTGFMTSRLADDELLVALRRARSERDDGVHQVRPEARQHAGRGDRGRPPRLAGRPDRRRADRPGRRRAASDPRPRGRAAGDRNGPAPDVVAAAAAAAAGECEPFTDGIATDWYRRRMVDLFVGRALGQARAVESEGR